MRSGALLHSGGGGTDRSNTLNISIWIMTRERFEERLFFIPFFFIYVRLNVFCLSRFLCFFSFVFFFACVYFFLSFCPVFLLHTFTVSMWSVLSLSFSSCWLWTITGSLSLSGPVWSPSGWMWYVLDQTWDQTLTDSDSVFPLFSPYPEPAAL